MINKVFCMPAHFATWLAFLLVIPVPAHSDTKRDRDARGVVDGIHVQRKGDSTYYNEQAMLSVKVLEGACKSAKQTCSMIVADPAASAKAKSRCASATGIFELKGGSPGSVGDQVVDEYFVPALSWHAQISRTKVLKQTGLCEAEVTERHQHRIRHYAAGGYTQYELKHSSGKGKHWIRSTRKVDPKLLSVLQAAFLAPDKISVFPEVGDKTYLTGLKCKIGEVKIANFTFNLCLHPTGLHFPAKVLLASKMVAGGEVYRQETVVSYKEKIGLPFDLFMPPAFDRVVDADAIDPDNATQKWCLAQKAKTGVNPCTDEPGDD